MYIDLRNRAQSSNWQWSKVKKSKTKGQYHSSSCLNLVRLKVRKMCGFFAKFPWLSLALGVDIFARNHS